MEQFQGFLNESLKEGETVEWQGKPALSKLLSPDNKKTTLTMWIIAIVIAAVLSGIYTVYALSDNAASFQPFIYVLTIGFPLIIFIDPIRDIRHINAQFFVLTDKRIFIFHKSTQTENKAIVLSFDEIDMARIEGLEPGFARIRFGSGSFESKGVKLFRHTTQGAKNKEDKLIGLVFYRLSGNDCNDICHLLKEKGVELEIKQDR